MVMNVLKNRQNLKLTLICLLLFGEECFSAPVHKSMVALNLPFVHGRGVALMARGEYRRGVRRISRIPGDRTFKEMSPANAVVPLGLPVLPVHSSDLSFPLHFTFDGEWEEFEWVSFVSVAAADHTTVSPVVVRLPPF